MTAAEKPAARPTPGPTPEPTFWPAPAKLNLFLRITGRRADGYHSLQTVFQFIDLADYLAFQINTAGRVSRLRRHNDFTERDDLCVKAAELLRRHTATRYGADITLEKNLPIGGGVGGGSSDAATTLIALNHLWRTGLDSSELSSLGLRLGADVPVFLHGRSCWAEGVGETFTDIEPPQPAYVLIYPNTPVSTAGIFAAKGLTRDSPPVTIADFLAACRGDGLGNDCEAEARRRSPAVDAAMRWLGRHAPARLSGTGSCVFAAMPGMGQARQIAAAAKRESRGWKCYATQGCNHSPLHRMVENLVK